MAIQIHRYDLPDFKIFEDEEAKCHFSTWRPDATYIILGASNNAEKSLNKEAVLTDNVKVYKRPSGGEAVILTPNTLVIFAIVKDEHIGNAHSVFNKINHLILSVLEELGVKMLQMKGISDISIGEKKILGSAIYRKRGRIFYHAVLNVSEPIESISRYLKHPAKEPDYRKGRSHSEFVTSLKEEGYDVDFKQLIRLLEERIFLGDGEQVLSNK